MLLGDTLQVLMPGGQLLRMLLRVLLRVRGEVRAEDQGLHSGCQFGGVNASLELCTTFIFEPPKGGSKSSCRRPCDSRCVPPSVR